MAASADNNLKDKGDPSLAPKEGGLIESVFVLEIKSALLCLD